MNVELSVVLKLSELEGKVLDAILIYSFVSKFSFLGVFDFADFLDFWDEPKACFLVQKLSKI